MNIEVTEIAVYGFLRTFKLSTDACYLPVTGYIGLPSKGHSHEKNTRVLVRFHPVFTFGIGHLIETSY